MECRKWFWNHDQNIKSYKKYQNSLENCTYETPWEDEDYMPCALK